MIRARLALPLSRPQSAKRKAELNRYEGRAAFDENPVLVARFNSHAVRGFSKNGGDRNAVASAKQEERRGKETAVLD